MRNSAASSRRPTLAFVSCAALLMLALAVALPAHAVDPQTAPDLEAEDGPEGSADVLSFDTDESQRMTEPVRIGGNGPYPFIIDTGAQRTVIAVESARRLRLKIGTPIEIHSLGDAKPVRTAVIPNMVVNRLIIGAIEAPTLDHYNLGAAGILGLGALQGQRVEIDFKAGTMTMIPSTRPQEKWEGETIVVTARSRLGQFVLADAAVDGEHVDVIIDTGGQLSVGNDPLRRRLFDRRKNEEQWHSLELLSVTGETTGVEYTTVNRLRVAGAVIQNLPVAFAQAHVFRSLGLLRTPALLLGMDALRMFDRVSIDFGTRKIRFHMPGVAGHAPAIQTAKAAPPLDQH